MMSVTSIFSIVLLPLMLVFPWIMKKIGGMSKMVGVFACIGIVGYIIVFVSGVKPDRRPARRCAGRSGRSAFGILRRSVHYELLHL